MPFWSSQTVKERIGGKENPGLITPFDPSLVRQGAVQLRVGPQAAKSSGEVSEIKQLTSGVIFSIPPGQFALLITEEVISLPSNVFALISVKTRYKSRGLVNVSGFHVDPGFHGRLKFWVYNAGSQEIILQRYDKAFHIWFSQFDYAVSDPFVNSGDQMQITSDDVVSMQHGKIPTPGALRTEFDSFQLKINKDHEALAGRVSLLMGLTFGLGSAVFMLLLGKYLSGETAAIAIKKVDNATVIQAPPLSDSSSSVRPDVVFVPALPIDMVNGMKGLSSSGDSLNAR